MNGIDTVYTQYFLKDKQMFELFHDKDNAILYLFNVVYMLYELCGYLYFFLNWVLYEIMPSIYIST